MAWVILALLCSFLLVASCSGKSADDDSDEDAGDDANTDDDDDDIQSPPLALEAVEPSAGGASVTTSVTLSGSGFAQGMTILVGNISA